MTDIDDDTDYSEPCDCGHTHRKHWPTTCTDTRRELDRAQLPAPVYVDEDNPFEWPSNWPSVTEAPMRETPCTCTRFSPADPEPPEGY